MGGQRSSLILEAIRLINECRPRVFIWEMLKELSPQTMAKILRQSSKPLPTLGAIDLNGNCVIHRGFYPQNRERIYLVGYSAETPGDWRGVFPIQKDDRLFNAERGKQMGITRWGIRMCTNNNCKILEDGLI